MSVMLSSMLMVVMVAAAAAADTDYSSVTCPKGTVHTMIVYPADKLGDACHEVGGRGVSAADQTEILIAHNTIRRDVKRGLYADNNLPAAKVMPDLTWDEELAAVAQRWADQCSDGHDACRDVKRFHVGQNAAYAWIMSTQSKNWTSQAVDRWFFDELGMFTQTDLTFDGEKGVGHLTQVIWAKTTKVGCGYIAFPEAVQFGDVYYNLVKHNFICNYGEAGNYEGPIYQRAG